jgi:hypothetical protein
MVKSLRAWPSPALGLLFLVFPPSALLVAPEGLRESLRAQRWAYTAYFALLAIWGTLGVLAVVMLLSALVRGAF